MELTYKSWDGKYGLPILLGVLGAVLPLGIAVQALLGTKPFDERDTPIISTVTGAFWLAGAIVLMRVPFRGARLEGTTLIVGDLLETVRVDVAATRDVWLEPVHVRHRRRYYTGGDRPGDYMVARLCALAPNGRVLRLPLAGFRWIMPPAELHAVAAAVEAGVRDTADAERAAALAAYLRHGPLWYEFFPGDDW